MGKRATVVLSLIVEFDIAPMADTIAMPSAKACDARPARTM